MKDAEKKQLADKAGAPPVEITVAKDGLSVYVNDSNPLTELTMDQLKQIFTGKIDQLEGASAGRTPRSSPTRARTARGPTSSSRSTCSQNADYTPRAQAMPGTAAVVNAVVKEKFGIGYGGAAYAKGIKVLKIKKDAGRAGDRPRRTRPSRTAPTRCRARCSSTCAPSRRPRSRPSPTGCCRPKGRGSSPRWDISPSNSPDSGQMTELVPAMFRRRHEFEAAGSPIVPNLVA